MEESPVAHRLSSAHTRVVRYSEGWYHPITSLESILTSTVHSECLLLGVVPSIRAVGSQTYTSTSPVTAMIGYLVQNSNIVVLILYSVTDQ